jgi:uncharacterized protein YbaR (Trm112 family)
MPPRFDAELIQMIRCPVTKSELTLAPDSVIEDLNRQIESGTAVNRIGQTIVEKLDGGFVNTDRSLLLPVRGGIVILIADQSIPLDGVAL